ncbi:hypothetical protein [Carbonactinospora thermoautotrophica]|nr:hypothetical protein [Carbonactinospora thermoautotrophica]
MRSSYHPVDLARVRALLDDAPGGAWTLHPYPSRGTSRIYTG